MKKYLLITALCSALFISCSKKEEETAVEQQETKTQAAAPPPAPKTLEELRAEELASIKDGKTLFTKLNCITCHGVEGVKTGPPLEEIAKAYKNDKEGLIRFLRGEAKPRIVQGSQAQLMHLQVRVTKKLPQDQLEALANYILKFAKQSS